LKKQHKIFLLLGIVLLIGFCVSLGFVAMGSGLTLWTGLNRRPPAPVPTLRIVSLKMATPRPPTPSLTPTFTPTATFTPTPPPTDTATPLPPSPTPAPPTATPSPPSRSTATPAPALNEIEEPTSTSTPSFAFVVAETAQFPTSHFDFDVYVAITDAHNAPLGGYRVLGRHSGGLQVDSPASAGEWTENSGAKHYKAGNIKYHVSNSPGGVWTLQLINPEGQPAAPPVECPFDPAGPNWYFVLYRRSE